MTISIITICLNDIYLDRTVQSVLSQNYKNYDYWIIDGGSTHSQTIDILKKYQDDKRIKIISEKDEGRYDAMNKGIKLSKGEYLIFLNAGDYFYSESSLNLFASACEGQEIIYGDLEFITPEQTYIYKYPHSLTYSFFLNESLPHPASFIKRIVFEKIGIYDVNLQIIADWAFFVKALCMHNLSYKHLPHVISSFNHGGISSIYGSDEIIRTEKNEFQKNHLSLFINDYNEMANMRDVIYKLKNSRLRKYLSYFLKQLKM